MLALLAWVAVLAGIPLFLGANLAGGGGLLLVAATNDLGRIVVATDVSPHFGSEIRNS